MKFNDTGLELYSPDKVLESENGVWVRFPGDREFLILRAGGTNHAFTRAFQTAIKPYRRQLDRGSMDPEDSNRIARSVFCRHALKDWRGIQDADGNPVPFSPAVAEEFFEQFPELFNDIFTLSSDMVTFTKEFIEEAKESLGNS